MGERGLAEPRETGQIIGMAALVRLLFEGGDAGRALAPLKDRVRRDPADAAALLDLSFLLLASGQRPEGLRLQSAALAQSRCYRCVHGRGGGLRVLAFVTAGDLMANTPIDFLLEGSDCELWLYYLDAATPDLADLPAHDVAFVAIGESEEHRGVLANLERLLTSYQGPLVNGQPDRIAALTRDGVAQALAGEPTLLAPPTIRTDRRTLELLARGLLSLTLLFPDAALPLIARPVGSHAGVGMEKIESMAALQGFLARRTEQAFHLTSFVDYRAADGLFHKQRIAVIEGRAYPSHCASSGHWMVHYLSAQMTEHAERRAQEAQFMRNFDSDFAARHARAFDALSRRIGLDYFVIDCAELPDGRLLVFEVDVAAIVHAMDPPATFPYKQPAMRRLFTAFQDALRRAYERHGGAAGIVCAHSLRPAVYQRTRDDCLVCALAMLTGRDYGEVVDAAVRLDPSFPRGGPMSHSLMRAVAQGWGFVLLSSIYMLWNRPAIVGVLSPTTPDTGHAVFWDGQKIIDPGASQRVDRAYVDRHALEFTQRARDVTPLIDLDRRG